MPTFHRAIDDRGLKSRMPRLAALFARREIIP